MQHNSVSVNSNLSTTHFFIYKGKQYPFNMVLFNLFSNYFNSNQQFQQNAEIKLINDKEDCNDIPSESIQDFINYCQNHGINLTKANVTFVHKLAKKFDVASLIKSTEEFITTNSKEFVVEFLTMNQDQRNFDASLYEDMIANDINKYIRDDKLLTLPLTVLHRIVTKYQLKLISDEPKNEIPTEFIDFLFKCLDQFGKKASVLFDNFDCGKLNGKVTHRLLNEYSEKFDFHFINPVQLKTIYNLESRIIEREENMKKELAMMKNENEKLRKSEQEMSKKIADFIKNQEEEERVKKKFLEQFRAEMNDEIRKAIQNHEELIKQKDNEIRDISERLERMRASNEESLRMQREGFTNESNFLREQIRNLTEKVTQQNSLIKRLNEDVDDINQPSLSCQFVCESDPKGAIAKLGDAVSLSAGGRHNPNNLPKVLKNYDGANFYNYYNSYTPCSENDSFIIFDFGSKKIDLYSYLIRSCGSSPSSHYHPKTWRVEGSNDKSQWTRLDRRVDDPDLNGPNKQHNFACQNVRHGIKNSRFRYIRYVQEDSWFYNHPYYICFPYFELYGNVYDN